MNIFYILGLSFGGVTLAGIAVIFGYLVKKQESIHLQPREEIGYGELIKNILLRKMQNILEILLKHMAESRWKRNFNDLRIYLRIYPYFIENNNVKNSTYSISFLIDRL